MVSTPMMPTMVCAGTPNSLSARASVSALSCQKRRPARSLRDTRTGLVWTQSDNGRGIDWNGASAHCQAKDMRLPTIDELQAIYDRPGAGTTSCDPRICKVSPLFRLTSIFFWSGTQEGSSRAFYFSLVYGNRGTTTLGHSRYRRALCVGRS